MTRTPLTAALVVRAAADLADRDGYDAVTLSAVARTLGVQTASLYTHVRDRAAVLAGVHDLALDELADHIARAVAGRAGRDALAGLAAAHRDYAREHPGRWTALQRPGPATPTDPADSPAPAPTPGAARVVELTFAVLRGYALPDDEVVHATRLVGATVNGFIALQGGGNFDRRPQDAELSWQRMVGALDVALTSWAAVRATP